MGIKKSVRNDYRGRMLRVGEQTKINYRVCCEIKVPAVPPV